MLFLVGLRRDVFHARHHDGICGIGANQLSTVVRLRLIRAERLRDVARIVLAEKYASSRGRSLLAVVKGAAVREHEVRERADFGSRRRRMYEITNSIPSACLRLCTLCETVRSTNSLCLLRATFPLCERRCCWRSSRLHAERGLR